MTRSKDTPNCRLAHSGRLVLDGIYRTYLGTRQRQQIWIVDGARVARDIYPPFVMGGNDQRYRFNPANDVWIDNRIGCEELEYTIAHELIERKLMRQKGMTYNRAHNFGLDLEGKMRESDRRKAARYARGLDARIAGAYRRPYGSVDGLSVWIVDGPFVRKNLDGDFCFGAHDLMYPFIPEGEVWLDSAMSSEHAYFALVHQLEERRLTASGFSQEDAYDCALVHRINEQVRQEKLAAEHELAIEAVTYGVRERGVKVKARRTRR